MVQSDFTEFQRELEYHFREVQSKPLVDPDTGNVYDENKQHSFIEDDEEDSEVQDEDDLDIDTRIKNTLAINERFM